MSIGTHIQTLFVTLEAQGLMSNATLLTPRSVTSDSDGEVTRNMVTRSVLRVVDITQLQTFGGIADQNRRTLLIDGTSLSSGIQTNDQFEIDSVVWNVVSVTVDLPGTTPIYTVVLSRS